MPSVPNPPSAGDLDAAVRHVAYEVAALDACAWLYDRHRTWFYLESFLLHARLLREFFLEQWDANLRHAGSAVCAENYFSSVGQWRALKGGLLKKALDSTKTAIDNQLAHITRERDSAFTDLEAQVSSLRTEVLGYWEKFLNELGADPRRRCFEEYVAAIRPNLGPT